MTSDQPYHPDQDRKALRWVLAVPLVILHVLSAGCCYYALATRPGNAVDTAAVDAIVLLSVMTILLSACALAITLTPSARRSLGSWWLVPPAAMILLAALRWATV
ncbi:hypothetical protein [Streptomyces sp. NPDC006368]|uniref:hypothetical protein n=1 Tax=Streptomyces sp. NPDC006368 TaxID=3156760 RepID=UPI0033A18953